MYSKKKTNKQQHLQRKKLPDPIIYDPDKNQTNIQLVQHADDSLRQHRQRTTKDAIEITTYYLELHKNIINMYNSVYSQILHDIYNFSWNDFTISGRFTNYPFHIQNMYTNLISKDESLKLINNIITNNLDTFIKSMELTQKFYKDIIQSYPNYIKKRSRVTI